MRGIPVNEPLLNRNEKSICVNVLKAVGIQAGDEIIMPTLTIILCAMAVTKLGAIPVLWILMR